MRQSLIKKISVESLFGKFTYEIPRIGDLQSPAILYGDNGVGKSTVLSMAFHLLSSANDRSHRSTLRKIPFLKFSVELFNDTIISAIREKDIDHPVLDLRIYQSNILTAQWIYSNSSNKFFGGDAIFLKGIEGIHLPDDIMREYLQNTFEFEKKRGKLKRKSDGVLRGEENFIKKLGDVAPKMFYLNADRKLDSDSVTEPTDIGDMRRLISSGSVKTATDILRHSRSLSLTQALENAARWVNQRAVRGANRGSENTHSAYEAILDQIAKNYTSETDEFDQEQANELVKIVRNIENDTKNFSRYELAAELKMEKFTDALFKGSENSISISARLIEPYIRGLEKRIEAIRPIYNVLENFVSTINDFLSGKSLHYSLSAGFFIKDEKGDFLEADQLSSGEQQLLLIFSHVLAAREHPSVFIIDEPEISLNIKWQRKIVHSLLSVAEQSEIQFLFASHSLELISQHSDAVVGIGRL